MNDKYMDDRTQDALSRFEEFDWSNTFCANQDSFETFTLMVRNGLRAELAEIIDNLGNLPFSHVNTVLVVIGFGAVREGARALASLTGHLCTVQDPLQVDFNTIWDAANDLGNPMSQDVAGLHSTVEQCPQIDGVLGLAQANLLGNLIRKFPELADHESELGQILLANLLNGVRLEYLFPILIQRQQEEEELLRLLLGKAAAEPEMQGTALVRLKQRLEISDRAHPWPMDHACICGANLYCQLTCCDGTQPIDPATFVDKLAPNFILKSPCCGASLTGFRCGTCSRYYTWTKGTIQTLTNP